MRLNGNNGFTLIEMLVVLVAMVIVLGVSIPAVANITRSEAASEAGRFSTFLRKTFLSAVREGQYLRIAIDLRSGDYWAEKTDTPFFLMTAKEQEPFDRGNAALLAEYEEAEKSGSSLKTGTGASAQNFFQLLSMQASDDAMNDDLYHWENFVPPPRSLREILKPDFSPVSERRRLPSSLQWRQFFSYHTPDIVTPDDEEEQAPEDRVVYIYLFPQGRISPFYLSLGTKEREEEPLLHLSSDLFFRVKIERGPFDEEVKRLVGEMEEDADAEGK